MPHPQAPDPVLVAASAMVFVADPAAPEVEEADRRHLVDVLRLLPGELVVAADGHGRWAPCRLADPKGPKGQEGPKGPKGPRGTGGTRAAVPTALLIADGPVVEAPLAHPVVTVAFAPTKGDRPEWVVQKLTELGVDRIVPLRTARSVVRWEGERGQRALERLRRVGREAAAQCRRPRLPEITAVSRLEDLAALCGAQPVLADHGGAPPTLGHPVVAVGPEGGWDDAEREVCGGSLGLGPTVLRAETAAVVAGAVLCGLRSGLVLPVA